MSLSTKIKTLASYLLLNKGQMNARDYWQALRIIKASDDFSCGSEAYYINGSIVKRLKSITFNNGKPIDKGRHCFTFELRSTNPLTARSGRFYFGEKTITRVNESYKVRHLPNRKHYNQTVGGDYIYGGDIFGDLSKRKTERITSELDWTTKTITETVPDRKRVSDSPWLQKLCKEIIKTTIENNPARFAEYQIECGM